MIIHESCHVIVFRVDGSWERRWLEGSHIYVLVNGGWWGGARLIVTELSWVDVTLLCVTESETQSPGIATMQPERLFQPLFLES